MRGDSTAEYMSFLAYDVAHSFESSDRLRTSIYVSALTHLMDREAAFLVAAYFREPV